MTSAAVLVDTAQAGGEGIHASHSQTGEGRWPVLAHCLGGCNEGDPARVRELVVLWLGGTGE